MQNKNGVNSIIGRYVIIDPIVRIYSQNGMEHGNNLFGEINGYKPERYVICSTMEFKGLDYIYSLDDRKPLEAENGSNPLGGPFCGEGSTLNLLTPPEEEDDAVGDDDDNGQGLCNIDEVCPCEGDWNNHGQYVICVSKMATWCMKNGLITGRQRGQLVSEAARTDCGKE